MNNNLRTLAQYRLDRASETLLEAKLLFETGHFNGSVNRLYYAAFYAARALLAIKGLDSSKHSGVISLFNKEFVKEGIIDKSTGKALTKAFKLRSEGDYQDFRRFNNAEIEELVADVSGLIQEALLFINDTSEI